MNQTPTQATVYVPTEPSGLDAYTVNPVPATMLPIVAVKPSTAASSARVPMNVAVMLLDAVTHV
jgi:hypothetical protein